MKKQWKNTNGVLSCQTDKGEWLHVIPTGEKFEAVVESEFAFQVVGIFSHPKEAIEALQGM